MHLAAHDGKLPHSLDEVKIVPLPIDPMTGKPFEYLLKDGVATLSSPKAPSLTYVLKVSKSK
jgi:hypothetical protein